MLVFSEVSVYSVWFSFSLNTMLKIGTGLTYVGGRGGGGVNCTCSARQWWVPPGTSCIARTSIYRYEVDLGCRRWLFLLDRLPTVSP